MDLDNKNLFDIWCVSICDDERSKYQIRIHWGTKQDKAIKNI